MTTPAALPGLLRDLDATQWHSAEWLAALQQRRLEALCKHFTAHSPPFRARLRTAGLPLDELLAPGGLQRLPVLSRRALQSTEQPDCEKIPATHAPTYEAHTSGSTGEPVVVRRTAVNGLDWMAVTMRDHLWHRREFTQRFCAIRASFRELTLMQDWGAPVNWLFRSGPLLGIPIGTTLDRQIELIREFKPQLLLIYPSNLAGVMNRNPDLPSVREILTIGETLPPKIRDEARERFGASIVDQYSSTELGTIALQCPEAPLYHVMAENLILEVLKEDGTACREGETGRAVVTDLRNFATPLIRYDIGDLAQVGPPCRCGRGLPTLGRILGRQRNLLLRPDGTRGWLSIDYLRLRQIAPVVQYQFVQDGEDTMELRLVTERPLYAAEESALAAHVLELLGLAFVLRFTYFEGRIPAGPTGKFEEFICTIGGTAPNTP